MTVRVGVVVQVIEGLGEFGTWTAFSWFLSMISLSCSAG